MVKPATLHLSFETSGSGTIVRVKQQEPPWRAVRGFQTPSGERLVHLHNLSGGILDKDQLAWRIDVCPGAQAQVTSTGATRIYRSRSPDSVAAQCASIRVDEDAYLEYLPDQLIPYAGSRFEQTVRMELAPRASLIWWDRVAPGREASGERFSYDLLSNSFELHAAGEPIAIERWTLAQPLDGLTSPLRLGRFHHFASCYVCRAGEPARYWRTLESELQNLTERLSGTEVIWAVTSLRVHGLVIRGVAVRGSSLAAGLVEIWRAAKWYLCGRVATLPRKVH
ncbi:MAG TPA: urease accessory protein UreD [Bryobacteraceae bacterium]|nr:urease accessory protein UreD [Bryobacteraceae bacterium]